MKHFKKVEVPARTDTVVDYRTCDLCRERLRHVTFIVAEVSVSHRSGRADVDGGGYGTETAFDLCGNCFDTKLVPWLKGQGAEPTVTEW